MSEDRYTEAEELLIGLRPGDAVEVRPVAVATLGAAAAILLAQLVFWAGKGKFGDGWVYKSARELRQETGLSASAQATARRVLIAHGLMRECLRGAPPTLHFQLDYDAVRSLLLSAALPDPRPQPAVFKKEKMSDFRDVAATWEDA